MTASLLAPERYPHLRGFAAGLPFDGVGVEFLPSLPTRRHGLSRLVLRPGLFDDQAVEFFAHGYCWLLGAALREATGWPYGLVERRCSDGWEWTHVGVITPGGRFLDVMGERDVDGVVAFLRLGYDLPTRIRAGGHADLREAMRMPADTAPDWWVSMLGTPLLLDVVRWFAATLLSRLPEPVRLEVA
ncbi:hypothetical protein [Nonomuraea longicatena]|uniref:hypothetical protein n=1 Tax=Nonomuraea longicatena TaxID=83682 RepID=UPI0031DB68F1